MFKYRFKKTFSGNDLLVIEDIVLLQRYFKKSNQKFFKSSNGFLIRFIKGFLDIEYHKSLITFPLLSTEGAYVIRNYFEESIEKIDIALKELQENLSKQGV